MRRHLPIAAQGLRNREERENRLPEMRCVNMIAVNGVGKFRSSFNAVDIIPPSAKWP